MSELPEGIARARAPTPRDSASAIVLRRGDGGRREVLLGVRSRRSRFMPGQLAFPGGGVDAADRPGEPGHAARCASRELEEETGLAVAPSDWIDVGLRVTPPMFPVRFKTYFFVAEPEVLPGAPAPRTAELDSLGFFEAPAVLEDWAAGRCGVPPPGLALLRALAECGAGTLSELAERLGAANDLEQRSPRIEFTPRIWVLPVRTATLPPATHTNVWMPGGERFVVIDPGSGDEAELARLAGVIERRRALGQLPRAVLLTHHHRDHVGGAAALAARLGLPVMAHRETLQRLPAAPDESARVEIEDGAEIDLAGMALRALHTPGHAAGHLAFHVPAEGVLIAGDLLSGLSTILIDPEHGDMGRYVDSLARAAGLGCRQLLPGHGPPLPGAALDRLIAHRAAREGRILDQLRGPAVALAAIARGAYEDVPRMPSRLTERQTLSHLLHLERRGRVRRAGPSTWSRA